MATKVELLKRVELAEETRKIQFSGRSSFMIALPKKWVEETGLRPGHQVTVARQTDGSLLVRPRSSAGIGGRTEIVINVAPKDTPGTLTRKVVSVYLLGYSVIHVQAKEGRLTSSQRATIDEVVRRRLIGTEIIADSTQGVTAQVLLSFPELNVETALKRMFLIAASMHRDAILALKKLDADSARGVIRADDEVDRFNLYVVRQLTLALQNMRVLQEIGIESPRDCLAYRLIVKSVERVADQAGKIAQEVLTLGRPLDDVTLDRITELSSYALRVFEESSLALFKRDYSAADISVEKGRLVADMEREVLFAMEKVGAIESFNTLRLIVRYIARAAEYASDIAEAVLNITVQRYGRAPSQATP